MDKVQYQAMKGILLHLSRARYAIRGATIWCQGVLFSAVAVRAVGVFELVVEAGDHALNAVASALCGDTVR